MAQAEWEALASSTISRKTVTAAWLFWRAKVLTVGPRGVQRVQARCLVATGPNSSRSASLRVLRRSMLAWERGSPSGNMESAVWTGATEAFTATAYL